MTTENRTTEAARKRYNRVAPVYDLMEILIERFRYSKWRELLWNKMEGNNILEVGVGTGKNFPYYPKDGESTAERVEYKSVESAVLNRLENPRLLRNFQNLDELERWLENIELLDIGSYVVAKETNQGIKSFDCDDYARKLQEKALRDGYIISFEIIHPNEYRELFKQGQIPDGTIHAINSVIIGNEVYYIEPKTNEIVFVAYLDWK